MPESHYFSSRPEVASAPQPVAISLPDVELTLTADRGVFSQHGLDRGTELLLRAVPPPPQHGVLLDLGCGYGAIATVVARRAPAATVYAIDVNERAVELASRNAESAGALNVQAMIPEAVPDTIRFDAIYSNPPIRVGKPALHGLLQRWLARLTPAGRAYLVVQRHLGSDSLQQWLISIGHPCERLRSRQGYRILEVQSLTPPQTRNV